MDTFTAISSPDQRNCQFEKLPIYVVSYSLLSSQAIITALRHKSEAHRSLTVAYRSESRPSLINRHREMKHNSIIILITLYSYSVSGVQLLFLSPLYVTF